MTKLIFTILVLLIWLYTLPAQESISQPNIISLIPPQGITLDKGWKFQSGDNAEWASADFNDRNWQSATLSDYNTYLARLKEKNIGWFRLHLLIDSSVQTKQLAIQLSQSGASEIYLNGELFQ